MQSMLKIKSSIHDYNVNFVDDFITTLTLNLNKNDIIFIDDKIYTKYKEKLEPLTEMYDIISIYASENQKEFSQIANYIKYIVERDFKKNNKLVTIGGGITQDIVGFISSIIFRGVDWHFYPTTLLSQGDSCIGGKTSINFGEIKNRLGNFYPPSNIYIDTNFLSTLSKKEIESGIGEMLHFYLLSSKSDFDFFIDNMEHPSSLIYKCLTIKKEFIETDEFDKNERLILNYGHSFGHALESVTNFKIPHGIAICYGMDISNYLSMKLGILNKYEYEKINIVLQEIYKNYPIGEIDLNKYLNALKKDKKNINENLTIIILEEIGNGKKIEIEINIFFIQTLKEFFNENLD